MTALALLVAAIVSASDGVTPTPGLVERRVVLMGTTFDLTVRADDRPSALRATESAMWEVARLEGLLSTWRGNGPILRLNRAAPGEEIALDSELFSLLSDVFRWSERTGRAFDPTVLPLVRAWDLRGSGRIASPDQISAALRSTGAGLFRLDAASRFIARLDPEAGLDEGAWGKGYALDRAAARLAAAGIDDACLDLGGEVLARGRGPEGAWKIPIAHPRERRRAAALLALPDGLSVSTSGDSERRRRVGGRNIGHLLDPRTGRPAPDFGSVSVVAGSAFIADVLSTAFFVLGPRDGLALSARLRREGVSNEALFLVERGGTLEALPTPGMARLVLSEDPDAVRGVR
jgi:thiamine biosynthesis lipoprotein